MKTAHLIILIAVLASVLGTFIVADTITGLTAAKNAFSGSGGFGTVTGNAISALNYARGAQTAISSALFGLISLAALVVVARIGANTVNDADENEPSMKTAIERAEKAAEKGSYPEAAALYNNIKLQYSQLDQLERLQYYPKIIGIHGQLAKQAKIAEASGLTDKYVTGTITEQEFERLRELLTSQ